jgi:hypothetical protein
MVITEKHYKVSTPALRRLILAEMLLTGYVTIKSISVALLAKDKNAKATPANISYHMSFLVDEGFVKQTTAYSLDMNNKHEFVYLKLKDGYELPTVKRVRPAKQRIEPLKPAFNNPFRNYAC